MSLAPSNLGRPCGVVALAALLAASVGLASVGLVGCDASDQGSPNPIAKPGMTLDAGTGQDAGLLDGGPPKRTIEQRNPWGGPAGNLLADGDFEHSTVHAGNQPQLGWWAFDATGQGRVDIRFETGGLCHSGLRCAVLEQHRTLIGFGAAANGTGMMGSVWAKGPAGKACADWLDVFLVDTNTGFVGGYLKPVQALPGTDGWCQYQSWFVAARDARALYLDSKLGSGETALVDSAVLAPDTGTVPTQDLVMLSPEQQQRLDAIVAYIRRHRQPDAPIPEAPAGLWPRQ